MFRSGLDRSIPRNAPHVARTITCGCWLLLGQSKQHKLAGCPASGCMDVTGGLHHTSSVLERTFQEKKCRASPTFRVVDVLGRRKPRVGPVFFRIS